MQARKQARLFDQDFVQLLELAFKVRYVRFDAIKALGQRIVHATSVGQAVGILNGIVMATPYVVGCGETTRLNSTHRNGNVSYLPDD